MNLSRLLRNGLLALLLSSAASSGLVASIEANSGQSIEASLVAAASPSGLFGASGQFTPADEFGRYRFLIEFDEPGLMTLHRQTRGTGQRFDFGAEDIQSESAALAARHAAFLDGLGARLGRDVEASHFFQITHSGMAVRLSETEVKQILALPEVASVERERLYFLDTFAGPEFIGAGSVWNGLTTPDGEPYRGEGMVAGVLDSGIVPTHPSFINDPVCGHGEGGVPDKLISFVDCSSTDGSGLCAGTNPIDTNGHGTHVASTVAGNLIGPDADPAPNPPTGDTISGVAYCAHIRNYKVCPGSSCPGADIQAGMSTLLADGDVDTMNFSISGGTSPWNDNDRRKLDLVDAGIFVNASAGNTSTAVPNPVGNVGHIGPWVTAVSMATRPDGAAGILSMSGPGTIPENLQNILMNRGSDSPVGSPFEGEVRYDADQPAGNDGCVGFPADFFVDAIAMVQRGGCAFTDKINNAAAAGAQVVVIWNNEAGTINMSTPGQANVPAYSITQAQGQAFIDFIDANPGATAAFTLDPDAGGDIMSGGSLIGPTRAPFQNLQKPDITGPGVGIYAADVTPSGYGTKSGTSMSGPHLSGAAVLVRQMQPEWAPIEVSSALRMTAKKDGFKPDGATAWDWDDVGSGRVELTRAALAGLVMNETFDNFLAANPATGGDLRTLNLPAVRDVSCSPDCTFTRTVRNTLTEPTSWSVSSEIISGDFDVSVTPASFSFSGDLSETQTLEITLAPNGTIPLSFGTIDFAEAGGLSPDLHFSVALAGTGDGGPEPEGVEGFDFAGTVAGISGSSTWASDLVMTITSPSGATFTVGGFLTGNPPWDFDGAGSTDDGTYTSSHPDVFFPGTDLDGNWELTFEHSFGGGVPMTWDPIIIELTGAARDLLGVLEVPTFTIIGGETTSFTIPVGDVPPPPDEPEIDVAPASLAQSLLPNTTAAQTLDIANVGEGTLDYSIEFLVEGNLTPLSETIIDQQTNGTSGIVSTFFEGLGTGAYSGEDFQISDSTSLSTITTRGFMGAPQEGAPPVPVTTINTITWSIYADDGGVPAGNPETASGEAVWTFTTDREGTGVVLDVNGSNVDITLDLETAGETVTLDPGNYWLVIHTSQAGEVSNGRWNWFQGGPPNFDVPKIITPGSAFGGAFPNWTDMTAVGPVWTGLSMTMTGAAGDAPVCDSDGPAWLSLSQTEGSVGAGDSDEITVTFDSTGLSTGIYATELCIASNDPASPLVLVPVTLEVEGDPATIAVTPAEVEAFVEAGGPEVDFGLDIANLGDGDLEWEFTSGDRSGAGTLLRTGGAASAPGLARKFDPALENFLRADNVQRGQIAGFTMRAPRTGTTLTHSASFDIMAGNTPVCSTDGGSSTRANAFLRVFDLADFGILDAFDVAEVSFGIENNSDEIDVEVNIYTLDGDFLYENLQLIGSTTATLAASSLELVDVPVAAFAEAGSTVVVEIQAPDLTGVGEFRPGSNQAGETAPSYTVAPSCNVPEPARYADLGLADVNLVMAVTGQASIVCATPSQISWLSADATSGLVTGGTSQQVTLTLGDGGQPVGTSLRENLCVASNDEANSLVVVPTTLNVVDEGETAPQASVNPASVDTAAIQGDTVAESVTVSNVGTANLVWSLDNVFGGTDVVLSENFADAIFPPTGWSQVNLAGADPNGRDWRRDTFQFNSAPASAQRTYSFPSAGVQDDWLITPQISLGENSQLNFADRGGFMSFYTGSFLQISTASCDPADGDFVELAEFNDSSATWREIEIDLSAFDNQDVCLAFHYVGQDGHDWWIDDVLVTATLPAPAAGCFDFDAESWLSVSPESGTINPAGEQPLALTFDTDGLAPGLYETDLCLFSNDPGANPARIPVSFDVIEFNPIADITPAQFAFEVFEGRADNGDLFIGNVGTTPLTWSLDTANLLPGLSYSDASDRNVDAANLPVGWDRASGRQPQGEVEHLIVGADFGRAVDGPIDEGFDDVSALPSRGWVLANLSQPVGLTSWFQGNPNVFTAFEGDNDSYIAANFNNASGSGLINNWLLSPETVLRNGTEIRFYTRADVFSDLFPDRLEVRYSTSGNSINVGTSADDVGDFDTLVASINPQLQPGGYPTEWTEIVVRLEGLPEPVAGRVALRYFVEDGGPAGSNSNYIGIDSFSITQPIACEFPGEVDWLSLSFFSGSGTGITDPGEVDSVTVNVDTNGLALGDYEAKVCVTTNDPAAQLVEIPVNLTVLGIPVANVDPESFDFVANAGDSDEGTLTISNVGTADLVWSIDTAPDPASAGALAGLFNDRVEIRDGAEVYVGQQLPTERPVPHGLVIGSLDGSVGLTAEEVLALATTDRATGPNLSVEGKTADGDYNSGAPFNSNLTLPIGVGNEVIGIGWEVTVDAFSPSWLSESSLAIVPNAGDGTGLFLSPGAGLDNPGVQTFSSDGVLLFSDVGIAPIPANAAGEIYFEWFEGFTDFPAAPDSEWSDPASGQVLLPGLRLICADQAACDEAVDPSAPEPPPVPERCVNPGAVDWLSVSQASGTTGVGESTELTVTADAAALVGGLFEASLCISTNEPDGVGLIEIPITFEVIDIALAQITPDSFEFTLEEGQTDSGTINIASLGQLDLDWSVAESVPRASRQDVLFDNGPLRTGVGDGPGGADSSLLQNSTLGLTTLGANVAQFQGGPQFRMADDFTVDDTWLLDGFTFFVYQTGSPPTSTITGVNLRIWDGDPANGGTVIFGDTSTNRLRSTAFTGMYRYSETTVGTARPVMSVEADVAGLVLEPGTYYVDVQFEGSLTSGPWLPPITIIGETTTGNAQQLTDTGWGPFTDSGAGTAQGMPFEIRGSTSQCIVPAEVPWLSVNPESGSVAPGDNQDAILSIDAAGLLAGTRLVDLCVYTNDPNQTTVAIPLTLTVTEAPGTGFVSGNVQSLGYCDDNPFPAAGATVAVEGAGGVIASTLADANGDYVLAVDEGASPISVSATAPDHLGQVVDDVMISEGNTSTVDFDLRIEQGCSTILQDEFMVAVGLGESAMRQLDLANSGAADSQFAIEQAELLQQVGAAVAASGRGTSLDQTADSETRAGAIRASEPVIRNIQVSAPRSDLNVLILSPDGELGDPVPPNNLAADLNAFPGINAVIFSEPLSSITLADFDGIDVAALTNNNRWVDTGADVIVGDVLADFVDVGGKVVVHNFAYDFFGFELAGRFITEDYGPITLATSDVQQAATMVILEPDSPLFDNVEAISYGTNFRLTGTTLTPGASLMAEWDDGVPMVTMNDDVVSINAMYSSDGQQGDWSGDLNVLVYNAVVLLAGPQETGPADWLTIAPTSGTIPADGDSVVELVFDSGMRQLPAGTYRANIRVELEEGLGETFEVTIPATFLVGTTQVQIAHLAPFAEDRAGTAVDVVVNGDTVLSDVRYGDSTVYLELPPGPTDIEIFPVGAADPAMTASADLAPGDFYTVLATGDGANQDLALKLLVDDPTTPAVGTFHLRLGHVAPFAEGGATADVRLADGTPVLTDVDFGEVSSYIPLPIGEYDLIITAPGGDPVLINPIALTFAEGEIVTALAVGDGVNQELGVFGMPQGAPGDFVPLVVPAELTVTPTELDFDQVALGSEATLSFTVANTGPVDAVGLQLTVLDAAPAAFTISGGDCTVGFVLAPGEDCNVEVTFTPESAGSLSGTVEVVSSDGQSVDVTMTGEGVQLPGTLAVDVGLLDFGDVLIGEQSVLSFQVSNAAPAGALALGLDTLALSGADSFMIVGGDCDAGTTVLQPGDQCGVEVQFSPDVSGQVQGTVNLGGDGQSVQVSLDGRGFGLGDLTLTPATVEFGSVLIGNAENRTLTLTNTAEEGSAAVLVSGILVAGHADFADTGEGDCEAGSTELAPAESCTIVVSYAPSAEGNVAASVVVDGADGKLASATLNGTGVEATDELFSDRFEVSQD